MTRRHAAEDMANQRDFARSKGVRIPKTPLETDVDADEVDKLALLIMGLLAKGTRLDLRRRALERAGRMLAQTGKRPGQKKT